MELTTPSQYGCPIDDETDEFPLPPPRRNGKFEPA